MNNNRFVVHTGDNLPILKTLADNSVDAIVTDPPAGISMMGKDWDSDKGGRDKWIEWMAGIAAECLRVIKPGGHALVWALPRTSHWTATAWENAGWEPRDRICHIFGSGFPKSTNISKQIDRMAGAEREVIRFERHGKTALGVMNDDTWQAQELVPYTAPATDAAKQWDGWGTALKPAVEDYWLFRKPIEKRLNIAQNVLKWGTGGLNIDGCRIATDGERPQGSGNPIKNAPREAIQPGRSGGNGGNTTSELGRWPAHLIHDGSEEVVRLFPVTGPSKAAARGGTNPNPMDWGNSRSDGTLIKGHDDQGGSASRFFYCAKPAKRERDAGLEELEAKQKVFNGQSGHSAGLAPGSVEDKFTTAPAKNFHPTVKALKLMTYLCRLITPPDGLILDPFTGSGSTGCAAMLEGFRFIGLEREEQYVEIAQKRIEYWRQVAEYTPPSAEQAQMTLLDMQDE